MDRPPTNYTLEKCRQPIKEHQEASGLALKGGDEMRWAHKMTDEAFVAAAIKPRNERQPL